MRFKVSWTYRVVCPRAFVVAMRFPAASYS
jgi:hypothetical protein